MPTFCSPPPLTNATLLGEEREVLQQLLKASQDKRYVVWQILNEGCSTNICWADQLDGYNSFAVQIEASRFDGES
ncbi:hypothetical protein LOK49_LG08G00194 [Camellia lanceoleosa]|uniref:Uncharacterized protein n=1 Tax=Camellia lanceoleosa TaxID=1840588 RepID=A0ACC0GTN4_9ERIC|nr:hypothetical protein LOK49_LG08G00194 [Camellia lanceoleosa]